MFASFQHANGVYRPVISDWSESGLVPGTKNVSPDWQSNVGGGPVRNRNACKPWHTFLEITHELARRYR